MRIFLFINSCLLFFGTHCRRQGSLKSSGKELIFPSFSQKFFLAVKIAFLYLGKFPFTIYREIKLFLWLARYFSLIFCTMMRNSNTQNVTEPDFWKGKDFLSENVRNMPEKLVFGISQDFIISFFWFFAQRCVFQ